MDSNLNYIRQQFQGYENNMANEKGYHHLENALESAMEVIENGTDGKECLISCNCIQTYLRKTINKAKELLCTSPNSEQLCAVYTSMKSFIDCGFDDIPKYFCQIKGKILIRWVEASMNEGELSEIKLYSCKKEIYEALLASGDPAAVAVASEVTGYPMVKDFNDVRPLSNDEKEEWLVYMKNKS
ncbi:MAG: hypothetical protein Q8P28_10605 [Deltaproteobacteria bacterium]|nr:hypothetical protein [Deltaproteobacteria bacterium]